MTDLMHRIFIRAWPVLAGGTALIIYSAFLKMLSFLNPRPLLQLLDPKVVTAIAVMSLASEAAWLAAYKVWKRRAESKQYSGDSLSPSKRKALYKAPEPKYLFDQPDGMIVLGRYRQKYVGLPCDPGGDGKVMLLTAAMGAGKSSGPLITSLLTLEGTTTSVLAIDIKGELSELTCDRHADNVYVLSPTLPFACGWDAWHELSAESTDDEVDTVCMHIASTLIGTTSSSEFWDNKAKNLLCGLLTGFFRKGEWADAITGEPMSGFGDAMYCAASSSAQAYIDVLLADEPLIKQFPRIAFYLAEYKQDAMAADTRTSILATMNARLSCFSRSDTRSFLTPSRRMAYPQILTTAPGSRLFISLTDSEAKVTFKDLLRLILAQTLRYLSERQPAEGRQLNHVLLALDEFLQVGRIDNLELFIGICRSKSTSMILVTQGVEKLKSVYGDKYMDLYYSCPYQLYLSGDGGSEKLLSQFGTYTDVTKSRQTNSISGNYERLISNSSEHDKQLLTAADLSRLQLKQEATFIAESRFQGIIKGIRSYQDQYFNALATHYKEINSHE